MGPSFELRIVHVLSLAFLSTAFLALSACAQSGEDNTEAGGDIGQSGDCSEADIERITAEILDRPAGTMDGEHMEDDDHESETMSDNMMPGGMMSEEMMGGMMSGMMGGMMGEGMMDEDMMHRMMERMHSGEMGERMRQRIVFDLSGRRDEACQVVQPNTIIGACTPEDIARLVAEIMAAIDEGEGAIDTDPLDEDHPHGEGTEAGDEHDDPSGG